MVIVPSRYRAFIQRSFGIRAYASNFRQVNVNISEPASKSKRQRFRETPLDQKLVAHLDSLKLGRSRADRRRRGPDHGRSRLFRNDTNQPPVSSFGRRKGLCYATAENWDELPKHNDPDSSTEIAFAGRSNVGKSSLLNTLLNISAYPETRSPTGPRPGLTQKLHFYSAATRKPLTLVDLPGYSFAYESEERIEAWNKLTLCYLRHRPQLKRICLLLDARHGLKLVDRQFINLVYDKTLLIDSSCEVPFNPPKMQIILTKCDLVDRFDLVRRIQLVRDELTEQLPSRAGRLQEIMVSAREGKGITQLQRELSSLHGERRKPK